MTLRPNPASQQPDQAHTNADQVGRFTVSAEHSYDVAVGPGQVNALQVALADGVLGDPLRVLVMTQATVSSVAEQVRQMCQDAGCETKIRVVPDGEAGKSLAVADEVWTELAEWGLGRGDLIVGVGGGALTDLTGFVAACWLRGVKFVTVATTVAGMVDAAVGGKTAVNVAAGKNLVGAFHSPHLVVCDTDHLATLPAEDVSAGLAEVVKCGFIADPGILDLINQEPDAARDVASATTQQLIERAIRVKADVVTSDFRESDRREILNYGHTFGHAIERCSDYSWRHGHAVAVGMMFVAHLRVALAHLAERPGMDEPTAVALLEQHQRALEALNLPTGAPDYAWDDLHQAMLRDKKVRRGILRFVVLDGIGAPAVHAAPSPTALSRAFNATVRV